MQHLGQALRQARESRGLTVEQAERDTRIRAKFLVGMENGDLSEIPSRVQARGFLYNYAQYLGLNPTDIVAQFDTIHGSASAQIPNATPAQPNAPVPAQTAPQSTSVSPPFSIPSKQLGA